MIIEYIKTADKSNKGNGWIKYSCISFKDTNIFFELDKIVQDNLDKTFDEIFDILKKTYKNKESKSRCDIYKTDNVIHICKPFKVLPTIWIIKEL